jgi:hypothetical protein
MGFNIVLGLSINTSLLPGMKNHHFLKADSDSDFLRGTGRMDA